MADNQYYGSIARSTHRRGYEDAIVVPEITADNFELKHGLLNLVQNKQFFGHDKEDPHKPARIWLEKEPPRSILTWDDLVSKFINKFFPPSKKTNLHNEIIRFQQRFNESFYKAWDRFNDLLRACPQHGFSELHQLDTFYNALNSNDQDSLNSAAGGNFLDKMPRECLRIIESKSKVCNSRNKPVVAKVGTSTSTFGISPDVAALTTDVAELKDMMKTLILDKKNPKLPLPYVKANDAVMQNMQSQMSNITDLLTKIANSNAASTSGSGSLPSNTVANPKGELKAITTRSGASYDGPQVPPPTSSLPKVVENEPEILSFEISLTDALILMPKFASTLKALFGNKEKLSEMARTPLNEHCSPVILNKLLEKLGDPGKFLIQCDFPGMDECLTLDDLGASINLMPLSVWKKLSLPELTTTCMTLEFADRTISHRICIAEDVYEILLKDRTSQEVLVFSDVRECAFPLLIMDPDPFLPLPDSHSLRDSDVLLEQKSRCFTSL
ncbi:reverse transcriptase domain-containing protein [Tanacetum coccineum]